MKIFVAVKNVMSNGHFIMPEECIMKIYVNSVCRSLCRPMRLVCGVS